MKRQLTFLSLLVLLSACSSNEAGFSQDELDTHVREYLFLELSMGLHDPAHVDAYFGPEDIRDDAAAQRLALDEIEQRANALQRALEPFAIDAKDALTAARIQGLQRRLGALETRIALRKGEAIDFDTESRQLFGTAAPDHGASYFEEILDQIDGLLGGDGDLPARVNAFQARFAIPGDKLSEVFDAAIEECRRRTLLHIELPENESFSIEYVNDKPWSGYNWYQGNAQSLIQVNTDLPIFINRAVDLGCHEGYPGHHTFNALLEENLVQDKGWLEFTIYPLFSPQSLIAEGSGNYGIELAFPGNERVQFEKDVLFPLAGLDATDADRYYRLLELLARLDYAGNEAARDYLNGTIDRDQAVRWLVDYALTEPARARQRTDFYDAYRSYVINYNLGKDLVREYVENGAADMNERWIRFERLLSTPMTAADLD